MLKQLIDFSKKLIPLEIKQRIMARSEKRQDAQRSAQRAAVIKNWEGAGKPSPNPHAVKQLLVEGYQKKTGYEILIETGTYLGDMVEAQRSNFKQIYSIELSQDFWQSAVKRFESFSQIHLLQGDSGKVLSSITEQLSAPAIFWLDGHYSGGNTAKGDKECPILEEINAILKNNHLKHLLLIDDARLFIGEADYPTIAELTQHIKNLNPSYQFALENDVIIYSSVDTLP